jgi:hypothetical protein
MYKAANAVLDRSVEDEVAEVVKEVLDDTGFSPEEAIPGLISLVISLAELTRYPEQSLDEAANILADSGVV